ncbi:hypothetical protein P280DRAFT_290511 [Massarina eburnea CBS 473.64]|uniref:Uncharacterized protein n=1 Tax=Massarina eburnea CBS 473.64 TaxID=1395130 RepID=A0A6A6S2F8_9PLEO|nr:hypothetical protein P280DRAFT_290511 [Massarina eburnea CBS 473.64]
MLPRSKNEKIFWEGSERSGDHWLMARERRNALGEARRLWEFGKVRDAERMRLTNPRRACFCTTYEGS